MKLSHLARRANSFLRRGKSRYNVVTGLIFKILETDVTHHYILCKDHEATYKVVETIKHGLGLMGIKFTTIGYHLTLIGHQQRIHILSIADYNSKKGKLAKGRCHYVE